MAKEQFLKINSKYPDGSIYITGLLVRKIAKPNRVSFGDKIGLWTWYAGNGNVSRQIIYIR